LQDLGGKEWKRSTGKKKVIMELCKSRVIYYCLQIIRYS
jgi:hypothetical protein